MTPAEMVESHPLEKRSEALIIANDSLKAAQTRQAFYSDRGRKEESFKVGDQVLVHRQLLLLWKLLNGEGPPSLFAKVPPLVECRGMQMLRRRTIEVPLCRTERRLRSFLPSTIKLWNSLPVYITSSSTSSTFLSALDSFLLKDKYSFGLV